MHGTISVRIFGLPAVPGCIPTLYQRNGKITRRLAVILLLFLCYQNIPWHIVSHKVAASRVTNIPSSSVSSMTLTNHTQNDQDAATPFVPNPIGALVFLAPQRHEGSIWGIDRFCLLMRAIRSVDMYLNSKFGPYPIHVLVAKDYQLDPKRLDGVYTEDDRALIRRWAPHSLIIFVEIEMYSGDALEPGTNRDKILDWRRGLEGAVEGRDLGYTSMCRLWSGRLQSMSFLDNYTYYWRMDDDSLLMAPLPFDPFERMQRRNLIYAYRRVASDQWGVEKLWEVSKAYIDSNRTNLPFVERRAGQVRYWGTQPYNNFHVSRVDFWRSETWQKIWKDYNNQHLFFKYRVGDANVHAMAIMTMDSNKFEVWPKFPYVHNSNDYGPRWGTKSWKLECQREYDTLLTANQ